MTAESRVAQESTWPFSEWQGREGGRHSQQDLFLFQQLPWPGAQRGSCSRCLEPCLGPSSGETPASRDELGARAALSACQAAGLVCLCSLLPWHALAMPGHLPWAHSGAVRPALSVEKSQGEAGGKRTEGSLLGGWLRCPKRSQQRRKCVWAGVPDPWQRQGVTEGCPGAPKVTVPSQRIIYVW